MSNVFTHARDYDLDAPLRLAYAWDFASDKLSDPNYSGEWVPDDISMGETIEGLTVSQPRIIATIELPGYGHVARVRIPSVWMRQHGELHENQRAIERMNFFIRNQANNTRGYESYWLSAIYYDTELCGDTQAWDRLPKDFVHEIRKLDKLVPKEK